jgi:hypothetical protein
LPEQDCVPFGRGERSSDGDHPQPHHRPCPQQEGSSAILNCTNFWPPDPKDGHFASVRINDTPTLLFDEDENFESHHYAFHVSDAEFDAIFSRIREANLVYGSAHRGLSAMVSSMTGTAAAVSIFVTLTAMCLNL